MAGPTEVGKEAFVVDRLKDFLNPSSEAAVVLGRFVEVNLLESWRFGFDQNVVADQSLRAGSAETELVHGIRVNQPVELVFSLRIRIALGGCLKLGNDQMAFVIRFD